ncbi:hypothetical protein BU17DRAFT_52719 [Hysterangium stoloniferum]|nr:hypothetical protein BU17DRAFT_52719 [Hysterangium stoloniferum]
MDSEDGDGYVRKTALFIRSHEQRLATVALTSRGHSQRTSAASAPSVLSWIGLGSAEQPPSKPLLFSVDPHRLFYLLMRFEALGVDVGSLDVRVPHLSHLTSSTILALKDKSDALSISSLRSTISSVSMFSLGGGWFGRQVPPSLDAELKFIYSAFTKLPALRVGASSPRLISQLANDPPNDSAVPMDAFKTLRMLECQDIDPRILMGWDRLSESLRSLTIKRSGLEDLSDLFTDSVIDDRLQREGISERVSRPKLVHRPPSSMRSRQSSFRTSQLPPSVPEDLEQDLQDSSKSQIALPERILPSSAWWLLTHLSLSDNNLTFIPPLPPLPNLLSLDLSSNLLISVPPSLSALSSLKSLNLAHNMVDSVLGIYDQIHSITALNISSNRLESLCGLERLDHLSRVDLRNNKVDDTGEVGRLAVLPQIKEIWMSGNPCTSRDQNWRVQCFDLFAKENREIRLDGSSPGIMERRAMLYQVHADRGIHSHNENGRPLSQTQHPTSAHTHILPTPPSSPHIAGLQQRPGHSPTPTEGQSSPGESIVQPRPRRRKPKRIVDLDDKESTDESGRENRILPTSHKRHSTNAGVIRYERFFGPIGLPMESVTLNDGIDKPVSPAVTADIPVEPSAPPRLSPSDPSATNSGTRPALKASRTLSSATTKSNKRRARMSPSMFEPPSMSERSLDMGHGQNPTADSSEGVSDAQLFRKRIEALRTEVGDSWLKVLSQTHLTSPDERH